MMKRNILAVIVPALLVAGTANAAEIYNKDGNKVDLYGKAVGLHYFSKGQWCKQLRRKRRQNLCPSWF